MPLGLSVFPPGDDPGAYERIPCPARPPPLRPTPGHGGAQGQREDGRVQGEQE